MTNRYEAVMEFINKCPLVGSDTYFNFVDTGENDSNTSLLTVPYGEVVKRYTDGDKLMKMTFEIRQNKPLSRDSNTTANTDAINLVQQFLDWINEQGKSRNYPEWDCRIEAMGTPEGVTTPSIAESSENGTLYAFPFEILYIERI